MSREHAILTEYCSFAEQNFMFVYLWHIPSPPSPLYVCVGARACICVCLSVRLSVSEIAVPLKCSSPQLLAQN